MNMQLSLVGQSFERTPGKHSFLNAILGRETGSIPFVIKNRGADFMNYPWCLVDLCAGDGVDSMTSGTCSPGIISKHARNFNQRNQDGARVLFVEKGDHQFDKLKDSLYVEGFDVYHGLNTDDRVLRFIEGNTSRTSPVFLHNDPNKVSDWNLSDELVNFFRYGKRRLTTLSTLGCNVRGLKRLPIEARLPWFQRLDNLCKAIPSDHDAQLFVLDRDKDQWSYLITGPNKWVNKDKRYEADFYNAFGNWKHGISMASRRRHPDKWKQLVNRLFFTKRELNDEYAD